MHLRFRNLLGVIAFTPALIVAACGVDSQNETQAQSAVTSGADLIESAASGSANVTGAAGDTFSIADTVKNQGSADAGASTTSTFLTTDGTTNFPNSRLAQRSVGALTAGSSDASPGTTMTLPTNVPDGDYSVRVCADTPGAVPESNESNNCSLATVGTTTTNLVVHLASPDLGVSSLSDPPSTLVLGQMFDVMDTTGNTGSSAATATAGPSTTRFYLSFDGTAKTKFLGERPVGSLMGGNSDGPVTTSVTVPPGTAAGSYFLLACADDKLAVGENNEKNNCRASAMATNVSGPNLIESGVTLDVNTVGVDGHVKVTESTDNTGTAPAGASRTKIFISTDSVHTVADWQLLPTCVYPYYRAIGTLAAGASSPATTTASLCYRESASTVVKHLQPGTYYIIACADENKEVAETVETDNCTVANTTLLVTADTTSKPDLVEIQVQGPTSDVTTGAGGRFDITDTASNQGTADAVASTTGFFLSTNGTTNFANSRLAQRSVPALTTNAQNTSSPATTMTIPPGMPDGDYFVRACADTPGVNPESNENNNCTVANEGTSATPLVVHLTSPDYIISSINELPPGPLKLGQSFTATDTTKNQGAGAAMVSSTTRFYLSTDRVSKSKFIGQRTVGALAGGASDGPTDTQVTIPAGTLQGSYYLLACADDKLNVPEGNEKNNCTASTTAQMLTGPNLVETNVTLSPSSVSSTSGSTTLTETVENHGNDDAAASRTRLYLSSDAVHSGDDLVLLPSCTYPYFRQIGTLTPTSTSPSSISAQMCYRDTTTGTNVRVPPGTYHVLACADDYHTVNETVENDNCTDATTTLTVTP